MSPTGKPTAVDYKAVASVCRDIANVGAVDPGTGEMVVGSELSPEGRAAFLQTACTQELYEEHKRRHDNCVRVALSAGSYEWYTPAPVIEAAHEVLGPFNLDPASSELANRTVKAKKFYTMHDDGLRHEWRGTVWCNPPYSKLTGPFSRRLVEAYERGDVTAAILLVNAQRTDCAFWEPLWRFPVCFTAGRIRFIDGETGEVSKSGNHGSALFYLGADIPRFERVFRQFGPVVATRDVWATSEERLA